MDAEDVESRSAFFKETDDLVFYTARYSWPSYVPKPQVILSNRKHIRNITRREGGAHKFKAGVPRSYKYALLLRVVLYFSVIVVSMILGMLSAVNIMLVASKLRVLRHTLEY